MKVQNSLTLIKHQLETSKFPVVFCSFGKDSMVLLHLVRSVFPEVPVVFYKEPTSAGKYRFAQQVAEEWDLIVHTFAPANVGLQQIGEVVEFYNSYQIGKDLMNLALNRIEPKPGEKCLCGILDFLMKPVAVSTFPFDLAFHGHKSCDTDPAYGNLKLKQEVFESKGNAKFVFPLKDWTDEEIWDYTEKYNLPIHTERYEKVEGKWQNKADKTFNPDCFPLCAKCLLSKESVECPRFNKLVPGRLGEIKITKPFIPTYVEEK